MGLLRSSPPYGVVRAGQPCLVIISTVPRVSWAWVCLHSGAVLLFATFLLKHGKEDVLVWELISKSTQGLQ